MEQQIYTLIAKAMGEIGAIAKDRKNQQQGFAYRGIDDVYNTLQPILARNGLFCLPVQMDIIEQKERTTQRGGTLLCTLIKSTFRVYAPDGSFVEGETFGEAMDSGDKSFNKAMSIAQKYFYFQTFSIPTAELVDPDAESHDLAPKPKSAPKPEQKPEPKQTKAKFVADMAAAPTDEQYLAWVAGMNECKTVKELHDYKDTHKDEWNKHVRKKFLRHQFDKAEAVLVENETKDALENLGNAEVSA